MSDQISDSLGAITGIPAERDPLARLGRALAQQKRLADLACDAAEKQWPGFMDAVTQAIADEEQARLALKADA